MSTPAPAINVNLTPCTTAHTCRDGHHSKWSGAPVLVPLPLEPWRSVTMTVVLGECKCGAEALRDHSRGSVLGAVLPCSNDCPARPIRVACSIGGDTWDGSKPVDFEVLPTHEDPPLAVMDACRARWALVKALVTGKPLDGMARDADHAIALGAMWGKRDAMFAALAESVRLEKALERTRANALTHLSESWRRIVAKMDGSASETILAGYVAGLIEQVGAMS